MALQAEGMQVDGNVILGQGFRAAGKVSLQSIEVRRNLQCNGAEFVNPQGTALSLDGANVSGTVFLSQGFKAIGEVRLVGVEIGGGLQCDGGQFINDAATALEAGGIEVKQMVLLGDGFKVDGYVNLRDAHIGRHLYLRRIASSRSLTLNLCSASVDTLVDEPASWPERGRLLLDGFVYDHIANEAPRDAAARIDWLSRQPEHFFSTQPYEQLAAVLRKAGHEEDAKKVLIAKNQHPALLEDMAFFGRCRHCLFGLGIGYGYRPWRAAKWSLAFIALGCLVFGVGARRNLMVRISEKHPRFNALVYSIDAFVPLVDLRMEAYWLPTRPWLRAYLWCHIAMGWVLCTLLVVGVTGLVRG